MKFRKSLTSHITAFCAIVLMCAIALFARGVFAADLTNPLTGSSTNKTIPEIIADIIEKTLGITGAAALVMFLYGGVLWMTAMGEEKRVKQGWDTMTWAALGMAAIFMSYAIVKFILNAVCGAQCT